jgi:hypothetical protein
MKLIKIKPRLVDHALLHKPVPIQAKALVIKRPKIVPEVSNNYSGLFNLIGFMILCIAGLIMYNRWSDKDKIETDKAHSIIGFNQYVKDTLSQMPAQTTEEQKSEPDINNL